MKTWNMIYVVTQIWATWSYFRHLNSIGPSTMVPVTTGSPLCHRQRIAPLQRLSQLAGCLWFAFTLSVLFSFWRPKINPLVFTFGFSCSSTGASGEGWAATETSHPRQTPHYFCRLGVSGWREGRIFAWEQRWKADGKSRDVILM